MCPDAQMFADIRKFTVLACDGKYGDDSAYQVDNRPRRASGCPVVFGSGLST